MHKQFMAFREEPGAFATSKDFYKNLLETFTTLAPLVRFLNDPLLGETRNGQLIGRLGKSVR